MLLCTSLSAHDKRSCSGWTAAFVFPIQYASSDCYRIQTLVPNYSLEVSSLDFFAFDSPFFFFNFGAYTYYFRINETLLELLILGYFNGGSYYYYYYSLWNISFMRSCPNYMEKHKLYHYSKLIRSCNFFFKKKKLQGFRMTLMKLFWRMLSDSMVKLLKVMSLVNFWVTIMVLYSRKVLSGNHCYF